MLALHINLIRKYFQIAKLQTPLNHSKSLSFLELSLLTPKDNSILVSVQRENRLSIKYRKVSSLTKRNEKNSK